MGLTGAKGARGEPGGRGEQGMMGPPGRPGEAGAAVSIPFSNCTVWASTNCTYVVEEIYSKLRTDGKIALLQTEEASCKSFFELEISIVYRSLNGNKYK